MHFPEITFVINQQRDKHIAGYHSIPDTNVFSDIYRFTSFFTEFKSSLITYSSSEYVDLQIHCSSAIGKEVASSGQLYGGGIWINLDQGTYNEVVAEIEKYLLVKNAEILLGINVNPDEEFYRHEEINSSDHYDIHHFKIMINLL